MIVKRTFVLGEDWLYYKIYCGIQTADQMLCNVLYPLLESWLVKEDVTKWFFIRYHDSDPHIRLRVLIKNPELLILFIMDFNKHIAPELEYGTIWNVQTDTYKREIERYGSNTIEICETIFFYDSRLVARALELNGNEEIYFLFILKCINQFIELFEPLGIKTKEFLELNHKAYNREFDVKKLTKLSIDKKYRVLRTKLEQFLGGKILHGQPPELNDLFENWKKKVHERVMVIRDIHDNNKLEVNLEDLLSSYIHMFINRAFRDKQRFYEFLIYDFLNKQLKTKMSHTKIIHQ